MRLNLTDNETLLMVSTKKVAIVIPIYKPFSKLSENELLSLTSSCKKLNPYPHILFGPGGLDWEEYFAFFNSHGVNTILEVFDARYFEDVQGYNKLLKSILFYDKFKSYKYILIFQTDAYILKDELVFWCDKEYDYIGAPWFGEIDINDLEKKITGVGNGGLSLRNVMSTISLLKRWRNLRLIRSFWFKSHIQSVIRFENFISYYKKYFKIKNEKKTNDIILAPFINEDYYLSQTLANIFTNYKVAPAEDAIKFSFEVNPSLLHKMNNNNLPFGCHAWEKNEPEFWQSVISF